MKLIFFLLLTKLIFCLKLKTRRWADKEDNPDDEELGKTTKGDSIGTNLYNSQVVTKAFIRPQTWFFNVDLTRPSKRIFEEAESNGLHYQIDRLRNELEKDYRRNMEELYDQRLEGLENKMRNAAKIKKFRMKTYSANGQKYPVYLNRTTSFLGVKEQVGLNKKSYIDVSTLKNARGLSNGALMVDNEVLDNYNFLKDYSSVKFAM